MRHAHAGKGASAREATSGATARGSPFDLRRRIQVHWYPAPGLVLSLGVRVLALPRVCAWVCAEMLACLVRACVLGFSCS